jgi:hypothetical protein
VLFSLSVDGEWGCRRAGVEDADPDDALVRSAFNAHQRRDKGVGAALGPDAPAHLAGRLRRLGYRVRVAPSPWRLGMEHAPDAALAAALIDGWLFAALEQQPAASARLRPGGRVKARRALRSRVRADRGTSSPPDAGASRSAGAMSSCASRRRSGRLAALASLLAGILADPPPACSRRWRSPSLAGVALLLGAHRCCLGVALAAHRAAVGHCAAVKR